MNWNLIFSLAAMLSFLTGFGLKQSSDQNPASSTQSSTEIISDIHSKNGMPQMPGGPGSSLFTPPAVERDYFPTDE